MEHLLYINTKFVTFLLILIYMYKGECSLFFLCVIAHMYFEVGSFWLVLLNQPIICNIHELIKLTITTRTMRLSFGSQPISKEVLQLRCISQIIWYHIRLILCLNFIIPFTEQNFINWRCSGITSKIKWYFNEFTMTN